VSGSIQFKGLEVLNETLRPYLTVLFRIAARGHYLRDGRPVREQSAERDYTRRPPAPPPVVVGDKIDSCFELITQPSLGLRFWRVFTWIEHDRDPCRSVTSMRNLDVDATT
jgi:hypothetical protein